MISHYVRMFLAKSQVSPPVVQVRRFLLCCSNFPYHSPPPQHLVSCVIVTLHRVLVVCLYFISTFLLSSQPPSSRIVHQGLKPLFRSNNSSILRTATDVNNLSSRLLRRRIESDRVWSLSWNREPARILHNSSPSRSSSAASSPKKGNRRVEWKPTRGARGPARKTELILVYYAFRTTSVRSPCAR